MSRAGRPHVRATLVALAVLASGCDGCKERRAEEEVPLAIADEPAPEDTPVVPRRVGVKVPMPPGWSAQVAQDGSFQFGPPGHPVLRVDLRPGQASALPSPESLVQSLEESFRGFERSLDQEEGGTDFTLVRVTLAPKLSDGGMGAEYPALFGARRVQDDLFLCATFPGVTADEVRQAGEACRGIEFQQPR
ncbi:hypothetical protein JRI60_00045 [Archangium violaceum]|uniref:hypothetical protein n=1 Tax=Archangium violaceum TaxID=83451 RepID=UPI0019502795|nr:hypothetical protein [Archangium violaceum]QRN97522.1 hypothetical protein JRI60_00045 [Archangium violaceum]